MTTPLKRLALLLCMLLVVLTAAASASLEQQQRETTSVEAIDGIDDRLSAAVSGCRLCQQTGQCDQAFRGTPGQFCQTLVSAAPCCCPVDSQCVLDNVYNCRCRRTVVSSNPNVRGATHTTTTSSSGSASSMIFFLLLMICCVCCCCGAAEKRHCRHERQYQYAQPVYTATATQYGTNDQYAYPSAPPMYEERGYPGGAGGGGNSSGFAAGAAGAVAGLAAGAFLGSAFSGDGGNSHQQTATSYFAGDSGGATSTFDFSGDTGGDDGGDFAGDS